MAGMFSDDFVGLEGLEVNEWDRLKSSLGTLLKLEQDTTKMLGERKRKAVKEKARAFEALKECIDEWLPRPVTKHRVAEDIQSKHGRPLLEDQRARRALRKLYSHVVSRKNPILVTNKDEWNSQLSLLVNDLCSSLADSATGDSSHTALWVPKERPMPLKGMLIAQYETDF
jgi:hypothetical protein